MGIIRRICPECGDHFTTNNPSRHYCSNDCRNGGGPCACVCDGCLSDDHCDRASCAQPA